ncbi:M28 family peptidase [Luteimonas sp. RD2P54]|uniref:M28 family peptidase n=1 Tax=Luteimonas endophytica TaxID=3042023 RepID=A0ABT6J763_9GAMM|nr:M28 family peptidase [Luteimonas endophytica]MDH5822651.1 M28 family peptidase [Luteimonas endophytica]
MSRTLRIVLALVALAAVCLALWRCTRPDGAPAGPDAGAPMADAVAQSSDPAAQRIEADLRRLADDAMEGRETGSRGYELAASYVAARFADAGLAPAGEDGGYYQRVPLLKATVEQEGARLAVERGGRTIELRFGEHFLPWANFNAPAHALAAPAVFVGHAIHAPEVGHDDFEGLELRGRIAVVLPGTPETFAPHLRAYHSAQREKLHALAARGAAGVVFVSTPQSEARLPWARVRAGWDKPAMRLRREDGAVIDGFPQLQAIAAVGVAAADFIFADQARSAAELFDAARAGTLRGFELPGVLHLAGRTRHEAIESRNVVARLPGSDPELAAEHVVHTAHLDHVGFGPADAEGDTINNGALDNALGVSIMLEAARTLVAAESAPRRSQLFVALTGEEQGLLGAQWFVTHPTVPRAGLVANINLDMPVLMAPSTDVVAIGSEHSSLGAAVETAAADLGVELSPDAFPEEVVFVRSDHYAFVRAGIPALYLDGGTTSADGERDPKLALAYFLRNCYHQPCDDASQPIQYDDAARLARLSAGLATVVGNDPERPRWNAGDFFGERFGGAAAPE